MEKQNVIHGDVEEKQDEQKEVMMDGKREEDEQKEQQPTKAKL